jgi:serine protease AprX
MRHSARNLMKLTLTSSTVLLVASIGGAGDKLHLQIGDRDIRSIESSSAAGQGNVLSDFSASTIATPQLVVSSSAKSYFIVQFKKPTSISEQRQIAKLNVKVVRYIPDDAYIVLAAESSLKTLQATNKNVNSYAKFSPSLKLSPLLAARSVFNKDATQNFNVHVFRGASTQDLANQLTKLGVIVNEVSGQTLAVTATQEKIDQLSQVEGVEWIAPPAKMKLRDFEMQATVRDDPPAEPIPVGDFSTLTGYESGTKILGLETAWNQNLIGQDQIVGVSDTGLDTGDMKTIAADFSTAIADTVVFGYGSTSWADAMGHGTHVSGTIASRGDLSQGRIRGGGYGSKIIMESLWSDQYKTLTTPKDLGSLFQKAYDEGARVHSNSWGDPDKKGIYDAEAGQVDQFMWDHPDMLVLFAAGNDGVDADKDGRVDPGSVSSPATAKNIISVGASQNLVNSGGIQRRVGEICTADGCLWPTEPLASSGLSNNANGLAPFSSRGPTKDGRIKPDIVAPGTNILSDCSHVPDASTLWGRFNQDYCFSGGTSMATPLVAGATAVVRQYLMTQVQEPSAALLKAVLLNTAFDMYPGQFGEIGKDKGQELLTHAPNADEGFGRVDIKNLLAAQYKMIDEKVGVGTGESKTYTPTGSVKKVTLVYTDFPASPTAATALVNNLDLEVHVGDQVYKSSSTIDNTEQVTLDSSASGNVQIIVVGNSVPMGKDNRQPYALVYSF